MTFSDDDLVNDLVNGLVNNGLQMIFDQCSFNCLLKRLFSTIFLDFTKWSVTDIQSWANARDAIASKNANNRETSLYGL